MGREGEGRLGSKEECRPRELHAGDPGRGLGREREGGLEATRDPCRMQPGE